MASVDEENIENQAKGEPCGGLRKELKECLLASDCVKLVCCGKSVSLKVVYVRTLIFGAVSEQVAGCRK